MRISRLTILAVLLMSATLSFAIHDDAGTTGFSFLRMNFSTHAAAMANAFTADTGTADGVFFNTAGLMNTEGTIASVSGMSYIEGFYGGSAAFVKPIRDAFKMAVFTQTLSKSGITRTVADDNGYYGGEDGTYDTSDFVFGLGAAFKVVPVVNGGINVKFIHESIDDKSASAIAFDFSVLHQTVNENIRVGLSMKNVGTQLSYYTDEEHDEGLPFGFTAGMNYTPTKKMTIDFDVEIPLDYDITGRLGAQYMLHKMLALRAGYKYEGHQWKTGGDNDFFSGMCCGFGIYWNDFIIDYAVSSYGDLGFVNQASISYAF